MNKSWAKKFISPKFVLSSWYESNLDISILTTTWQQKLAYQKSMLKYSDNLIEKSVNNNLLSDDLLSDDLLNGNIFIYIHSNINIDTKAKSNLGKDMINNNLLEKNFGINIENLFE